MNTLSKKWENSNIRKKHPSLYKSASFNESLKEKTSFKIGGPADMWVEVSNENELVDLINWSNENSIPVSVWGGGSNLVVSDNGIRGVVASLSRFNKIEQTSQEILEVGAGVKMDDLSKWCKENSLSGLEVFTALPGTLGGAVFMNARCYDVSLSDIFISAKSLHFEHKRCIIKDISFNDESWGYKKSPFQNNRKDNSLEISDGSIIVLSVKIRVKKGEKLEIEKKMNIIEKDREDKKHFLHPSGGSAFKNNRSYGKPTGQIVDEIGLKGTRVGDAQIAPWHGNFIINLGNAKAMDVFSLVKKTSLEVKNKTGFLIEPEILFIGEEFRRENYEN